MLIKINTLIKLVECAILTPYIKNNQIVSLFFIASAESGKSEIIKMVQPYENTFYTNDLSFKPLVENLLPSVEQEKLTHILIPDFINIVQHKRSSENLIPCLNSLMAEGVSNLRYYGVVRDYKKALHCGIITGITKRVFDKQIIFWRNVGFLTRMLIVTYKYSETTKLQIHQYIRKDGDVKVEKIKAKFKAYKKKFKIEIPEDIARQIEVLVVNAIDLGSIYTIKRTGNWKIDLKTYGFRLHKIFRSLIKAICLYNDVGKRKIVNQKDFNDLQVMNKHINFNFTEI